jgi:ADP-dependent NAD(P)H-hydrate dehydratase / NAD(P)H-hydrate epimerase
LLSGFVIQAQYNQRMPQLPTTIHSAAQVRELDRFAIEQLGIPGYTLMTRAGRAAFECLRAYWPQAQRILVVCGSGNNAGDGYVLARLARAAGLQVDTISLSETSKLMGDALTAFREFSAQGGVVESFDDQKLQQADVIVDAILGTGLTKPAETAATRSLDTRLVSCVAAINHVAKPVLALDIPTGLNADTGQVMGAAIHATHTITFVGLKMGFYLGEGPNYVGAIHFDGLGIPAGNLDESPCIARRLNRKVIESVLPPRSRLAHKGSNGRVLLVGGGRGMAGAVRLAGEAALRVGAGLVTVATRPENIAPIASACPELIVRSAENAADLQSLIAQADLIAIGPGLGKEEWSRVMYAMVLSSDKPLIVDADALNLLAMQRQARGNWVLTPHPGEASRLVSSDIAAIQADRLSVVREMAKRYNAIVVLKGAGSLVARENEPTQVCDCGNPGMATAGMGDVLTGVIVGLAAQTKDLWSATCAGVLIHSMAGDAAAQAGGERGLLASDLFPYLRHAVN